MSLGQIKASIVSGAIEATATLAHLNFDFSLVSIKAPVEFRDLGAALSPLRKKSAEVGKVHTTARKLGALFAALLPSVPELIKAYGARASEIARDFVKAKSSAEYGVFSGHAGIDGTSIWASATSGDGAIKVHLLACILARMWKPAEAASIWVEIVDERKREIMAAFESSTQTEMDTYMASMQELTREELRNWDASARAWLRIADDAKARQQKKFQLIISGFDLSVNNQPALFKNVLQVWTDALTGMESLIKGVSQRTHSGELLLGLSAFHLYPDLNVLATDKPLVQQNDPLVRGVLTIGTTPKGHEEKGGLHWSLPLAQLRYYGDPVLSTGTLSAEGSRLSLNEFLQTVLGCLLRGWEVDTENTENVLQWLIDLHKYCSLRMIVGYKAARLLLPAMGRMWISILSTAAEQYLTSKDSERKRNAKLINLGKKQFQFLGKPEKPFFGLLESKSLLSLQSRPETRVRLLRRIAAQTGCGTHDIIIRYRPGPYANFMYATAIPRHWTGRKWSKYEQDRQERSATHVRWIHEYRFSKSDALQSLGSCSDLDSLNAYVSGDVSKDFTPRMLDPNGPDPEEMIEVLRGCRVREGFSAEIKPVITWEQPGEAARVNHFEYWFGEVNEAALFVAVDGPTPRSLISFEFRDLADCFNSGQLQEDNLLRELYLGLEATGTGYVDALRAVASIANLSKVALDMSIDVHVLGKSLQEATWVRETRFTETLLSIIKARKMSTDMRPSRENEQPIDQYLSRSEFPTPSEKSRSSQETASGSTWNGLETRLGKRKRCDHDTDMDNEEGVRKKIGQVESHDVEGGSTKADTKSSGASQNNGAAKGDNARESEGDTVAAENLQTVMSPAVGLIDESTSSPELQPQHQQQDPLADVQFNTMLEDLIESRQEHRPIGIMKDLEDDSKIKTGKSQSETTWIPGSKTLESLLELSEKLSPFAMSQSQAFACIIMFESGSFDINPKLLLDVMAISSGESIFIAAPMLCDPFEVPEDWEIRRVIGNIGRAGMALLIPPAAPRIRKPRLEDWQLLNHAPWNGQFTDCFGSTSLHLSYTGSNVPLDVGSRGGQDTEVYMLESVVSVYERGQWVADLDILKALKDSSRLFRMPARPKKPSSITTIATTLPAGHDDRLPLPTQEHTNNLSSSSSSSIERNLTAIESWSEFLERPDDGGKHSIFMACKNWQARLAATAVCIAQGCEAYILATNEKEPCWDCVNRALLGEGSNGGEKAKDRVGAGLGRRGRILIG